MENAGLSKKRTRHFLRYKSYIGNELQHQESTGSRSQLNGSSRLCHRL